MIDALYALLVMFTLLWVASLWFANASIVDIWWGPAFVVALAAYLQFDLPQHPRGWLVLGATAVWALRLAWHIGQRNVGHGEDPRYRAWRDEHGRHWWWRSYFQVFALQAVIAWLVSSPLYFAAQGDAAFPSPLSTSSVLSCSSPGCYSKLSAMRNSPRSSVTPAAEGA